MLKKWNIKWILIVRFNRYRSERGLRRKMENKRRTKSNLKLNLGLYNKGPVVLLTGR